MIKNVLIDLDDTILDFKRAEAVAIRKTLLDIGVEPSDEIVQLYSEINDAHWKRMEKGELKREQVLVGRFAVLLEKLGVLSDPVAMRYAYENYIKQGHYFIDGAVELLEGLSKNYSVFLVSNGTAVVQDSRIKSAGIEKYFDGIYISQRVGHNKPAPEFFNEVFKSINDFRPEETIILGDSLSSDISGGRSVGIHTCLFSPNCNPSDLPDYKISALSEFLPLLSTLK